MNRGEEEEEEEEEAAAAAMNNTRLWPVFGQRIPRSEIVFFCQMLVIYAVVAVSLFNLTRGEGSDQLWTALLSSCLGYVLPNPTLEKKR